MRPSGSCSPSHAIRSSGSGAVADSPGITARAEAVNSRIQWVKRRACGYRSCDNLQNAIDFHVGGLDLYPEALKSAHLKS